MSRQKTEWRQCKFVVFWMFVHGEKYVQGETKTGMETGLIGGVEKREINIVDYDPDWPKQFQVHAHTIGNALRETALQIEHVGSTAVPDLAAKPIIDILVVVPDSAEESTYLPQLEASGYVLRVREPDWNEHRMFRNARKDVHIHIYSTGCVEVRRNLVFRDHLRANSDNRRRYERAERELAMKDWLDMNAYADGKTHVIESILAEAA